MKRHLLLSGVLYFLGCLTAFPVKAMPVAPVEEHELKAAYLYNFAMFTTWPSERAIQEGIFNVCVYADEAQTASISALQTRKIRERTLQVRQVRLPEETAGCHVLFVGKGGEDVLRVMESVRDNATLTVTDNLDATRKSAVISMALDNGRLAFDVSLQNAKRARLVLSSKLLKLARSAN